MAEAKRKHKEMMEFITQQGKEKSDLMAQMETQRLSEQDANSKPSEMSSTCTVTTMVIKKYPVH